MRVLQFGRFDFDEVKGGVQLYAEYLWQDLPEFGVEVDQLVSAEGPQTTVSEKKGRLKVSVASYGLFFSVPLSPGIFYWAWKMVRNRKYDVIHLNFPDPLALLVVFLLPRRIPVVVTWHSDIVRQKRMLKFYQPLVRFFMKRVKAILVATPRHLESCAQLQDLKMGEKIFVTPFGIREKDFQMTPALQSRVETMKAKYQGKFLLFALGRHVYYKGFSFLVEAMKELPGCHLILGGKGPLSEELKAQARALGVDSQIEFKGLIPAEDLPLYLWACDLFCFPSVDPSEAFGYAQVEAMICGKAVICCDLKNGVNFVNLDQVTGLVVPPRDTKALTEGIRSLQNNPELLQKLASEAQARALREFTSKKTAERTFEVYRKILN
jgi:rhamnosyl/mannosyltransferase